VDLRDGEEDCWRIAEGQIERGKTTNDGQHFIDDENRPIFFYTLNTVTFFSNQSTSNHFFSVPLKLKNKVCEYSVAAATMATAAPAFKYSLLFFPSDYHIYSQLGWIIKTPFCTQTPLTFFLKPTRCLYYHFWAINQLNA
jgi:hypothetical protein